MKIFELDGTSGSSNLSYNYAMPDINPLITKAKEILEKTPYDMGHDVFHHERVWGNAQIIVEKEKLHVDLDVLYVACMWHDVTLGKKDEAEARQLHIDETLDFLAELMKAEEFSESFRQQVIDAIRDHGFEKKKQANIEGEVLFDADKLDALDPNRYRKLVEAIQRKKLSRLKLFMYTQATKLWLRTMRNRYHFQTSKEIHDQRIQDLLQDTQTIQLAKELGVDIPKLIK